MATASTVTLQPPTLAGLAEIVPLSVNQYQQMIAAGIIPEGSPIELIEGYLVAKDRGRGPGMAHGEPHACSVHSLSENLLLAVRPRWVVCSQLPITLGDTDLPGGGSEPEPDAIVARGPRERYIDHHPSPREIRLAVEVSDSTLAYDRTVKARLYALAGIPVYWIVNLVDRQLEVYTRPDPHAGRYRAQEILTEDDQVVLRLPRTAPIAFPVRDFLP